MARLLLFAATTGYQIRVFAEAARRLGVDLTLATDRCHVLEDPWGDQAIAWAAEGGPRAGLAPLLDQLHGRGFDAIAAVGDESAVMAADAAKAMGIPFHPPGAVRACRDKHAARQLFAAAGLPVPRFFRVPLGDPPQDAARRAPYPCVLKPLSLSASRGVIRADNEDEFVAAFARIRAMLRGTADEFLQVEAYIPGREFAVEGVVTRGEVRVLAIFDKPEPLEGPFFEETIYVTPSRESTAAQDAMRAAVIRAVRALGLYHGPFHAEVRLNEDGVWILEVAARPIGGLCAKALRFGDGMPLEELLVRHAIGEDISALELVPGASGVVMIPVPRAGIYEDVAGVEEARQVSGIEDVIITAKAGQMLVPLPEGGSYPGFIFARGGDPAEVEEALRGAHAMLEFRVATTLPVMQG